MENFIIANCSDTGRVRSLNEDSMTAFDSPNGYVVVVCDGMGGQNAGDVASQLATTVITEILTDNTFDTPEEAISNSIIAANRAILIQAQNDPELSGMGSTCVMAIIKDGKVYYGGVGDSRIYYYSNGMIRQVTKDQSYVQTLVDMGEITQSMAEHHAEKNQITNALGLENMTPPVIGQMPIIPEVDSTVLLCSDGLTGMINNQAIASIMSRSDLTMQQRAETLVQQANEAGGEDNITIQLIHFPGEGSAIKGTTIASDKVTCKKKGNSLLVTTICSVLLLASCIGSAWWYYNNKTSDSKVTSDSTTEIKKKEQKINHPTEKKKEETKIVIETPKRLNKRNNPITDKIKQKNKKTPVKVEEKLQEKVKKEEPEVHIKIENLQKEKE